jgi:UDP-N-acetylglucosamine--N-acetylmuramyl-(pentapeptide) pyrophosphoryl-undecaprenol N-acetylglucosamine transferase
VRKEFFSVEPKARGEKVRLLIFGGSQGARAINNAVTDALDALPQDKLNITHQTGEADFEKIREIYKRAGWQSADVRPYISNMVEEFAKSDLIVCRAGATTCAELAAAGKAALMIPLPTAADDHQRKNAEALEKGGAARMILQRDLSGESLANEILNLVDSPEKISEMETSARKLARADAAERTVDLIEELGDLRT